MREIVNNFYEMSVLLIWDVVYEVEMWFCVDSVLVLVWGMVCFFGVYWYFLSVILVFICCGIEIREILVIFVFVLVFIFFVYLWWVDFGV